MIPSAPIRLSAQERGSVLIISMLILLVLTIMGVTALSMATLEERMARTVEQGEQAYHGSESGIMRAVDLASAQYRGADGLPKQRSATEYDQDDDPLLNAMQAATCSGTATVAYDPDPFDKFANTTLNSNIVVTYLGERTNVPGEQLGTTLVGQQFNISATTTVGSTGIRAVHNRGVYLVRAGTGACSYTSP